MPDDSPDAGPVRVADVIAALSLATDLGIGVPLEYGLQSTLFAMRLADRLDVDSETASQTYYTCLLFYSAARPMPTSPPNSSAPMTR